MAYYLAHQNTFKTGEEIFGADLAKLSFRYNKKCRFWYRIIDSTVLQLVGLGRFQGGTYELNYACAPLYVRFSQAGIEDKSGRVPYIPEEFASAILTNMQTLGLLARDALPRIGGSMWDSPDDTKRHMRMSFEIAILPVLKGAIDVPGCYEAYLRRKKLASEAMLQVGGYGHWHNWVRATCQLEVKCLLDMKRYDEASKIIRIDTEARIENGGLPAFDKYIPLAENRDEAAIRELLNRDYEESVQILQNTGFILD